MRTLSGARPNKQDGFDGGGTTSRVVRFVTPAMPRGTPRLVATPTDPRSTSNAAGAQPTTPRTELEQELQRAVEEIERGECSVLSRRGR